MSPKRWITRREMIPTRLVLEELPEKSVTPHSNLATQPLTRSRKRARVVKRVLAERMVASSFINADQTVNQSVCRRGLRESNRFLTNHAARSGTKRNIAQPALFDARVVANAQIDTSDVTQVRSKARD